jgi:hypothetical protein
MVDQYAPEKRSPAFCGWDGITPAEYNGWFTVFFPFITVEWPGEASHIERTPKIVTHNTKVCPEIKKVDVKYTWIDPITQTEEVHYLELWAGFIGMEMDWDNYTLKPAISWLMREKSAKDSALEKLDPEDIALLKQFGQDGALDHRRKAPYPEYRYSKNDVKTLVACQFPLVPMSECYKEVDKKCKCYKMITLKEVDIPQDLGEWCRNNYIESVTIKAPLTDEQKADILRQVPTASIVQL